LDWLERCTSRDPMASLSITNQKTKNTKTKKKESALSNRNISTLVSYRQHVSNHTKEYQQIHNEQNNYFRSKQRVNKKRKNVKMQQSKKTHAGEYNLIGSGIFFLGFQIFNNNVMKQREKKIRYEIENLKNLSSLDAIFDFRNKYLRAFILINIMDNNEIIH
jgi:vacuolar-type H+-ATPase subunit I/STV1